MKNLFNGIYKDKKVLITGHTGFKGSWLAFWLTKMGANVVGYSLTPPTEPNHFDLLDLNVDTVIGDIGDKKKLYETFLKYKPEIVFHLAAQPLVRLSYKEPIETLETNIIGTANVYEACKKTDSVKAIINVTSDKCYENKEWIWGYRENDEMGGYDPYSVSKGCSELITSAYRNSFFNTDEYKKSHNVLLASCRAGNVIGGGDWAEDRLLPDIIKATEKGLKVEIRSPYSTRPWQHVLEPLSGYLLVGQKLLEEKKEFASAWNFGPSEDGEITVKQVAEYCKKYWDEIDFELLNLDIKLHEASLLKLDCSKAYSELNWKSVWNAEITFDKTINWYKKYSQDKMINTESDLNYFIADAKIQNIEWCK
jgi:CDP-glucose 4,6-dehydratase